MAAFEVHSDSTISVSWMGYFPGTREVQLDKVREELQCVRDLKPSHRFLILCAGDIRSIDVRPVHLCVTHRPDCRPRYRQYAHSVIHGSVEMRGDEWLTVRTHLVKAVAECVPAMAAWLATYISPTFYLWKLRQWG